MKKTLLALLALSIGGFSIVVIYIGSGRHTLDSAAYRPNPVPELAPNEALAAGEHLAKGAIVKGEDVAVDPKGLVYAGSIADGKIYRLDSGTGRVDVFANTGASPVGMKFDGNGNLIVCVVPTGLVSFDAAGKATVLSESFDGRRYGFIDDLDIAADGKIYFSDATTRFTGRDGNPGFTHEVLDSRPYGSLYVYDPAIRETRLLLNGLYFANGIAVSPDQSFVLVAETFRSRVTRYWLQGEKAGTSDTYIDNLPGYPDGVMAASEGGFWVAMPFKRDPLAEMLQPWPFLKNLLAATPESLWAKPSRYGLLARVAEGAVIETLQDPSGKVFAVTNAVEAGDSLYLGTLEGDSVVRLRFR